MSIKKVVMNNITLFFDVEVEELDSTNGTLSVMIPYLNFPKFGFCRSSHQQHPAP
jgi:hypothetical protein